MLHYQDLAILRASHAIFPRLMTIRKGEPAYNPVRERVEPAEIEMVKVKGNGTTWSCAFYREEDSSCDIYENRFLECRLLSCWDPRDVLGIIGKETIRRVDVINPDDPILEMIELHEKQCSLESIGELIGALSGVGSRERAVGKLVSLVKADRALRSRAFRDLGLKREYEWFIFGRPIVDILRDAGATCKSAEFSAI